MTIDIEQIKRYHKHCKDMLGTFKIVGHERELDESVLSLVDKMEVLCGYIDSLLADNNRLRGMLVLCPECDEPTTYESMDRATGGMSYECENEHQWYVPGRKEHVFNEAANLFNGHPQTCKEKETK